MGVVLILKGCAHRQSLGHWMHAIEGDWEAKQISALSKLVVSNFIIAMQAGAYSGPYAERAFSCSCHIKWVDQVSTFSIQSTVSFFLVVAWFLTTVF